MEQRKPIRKTIVSISYVGIARKRTAKEAETAHINRLNTPMKVALVLLLTSRMLDIITVCISS